MRLGKVLCRSTMRTLSLCSGDIHGEYVAQFTCGSVAVKVVVVCELLRFSRGAKRSVRILSGSLPAAIRRLAALSTNDVGPHT